jgi:hypothetical protein
MIGVSRLASIAALVAGLAACGGGGEQAAATGSGGASSSSASSTGGAAPPCSTDDPGAWSTAMTLHAAHGDGETGLEAFVFGVVGVDDGVVVSSEVWAASVEVGAMHLTASPDDQLDFLSRFDACGAPVWVQEPRYGRIAGPTDDGAVLFGPVDGPATDDAIAVLDADGDRTSTIDFAGCLGATSFVPGPAGGLVFSGYYGNGAKAGSFPQPVLDPTSPSGFSCAAPTEWGVYVIELDARGHVVWLGTTPAGPFPTPLAVAASDAGVAITGSLVGDFDLGTTTLSPSTTPATFTALLDPNGDAVWALLDEGGGPIAVQPSGDVVVGSTCATGLALAGLDAATGDAAWRFCSPASSVLGQIALVPDGHTVLVSGSLGGGYDLLGMPNVAHASFAARFVDGALDAQQILSPDLGVAGIVPSLDGAVVVGTNDGTVDLGSGAFLEEHGEDLVLARVVFAAP